LSSVSTAAALRFHLAEGEGWRWRDGAIVVVAALILRLGFAVITSGTYDPDEFVMLALSRQMLHGAVAYQDFTFFHPPGMLVILGGLQPVINAWWPFARLFIVTVDVTTAFLVWRIATAIYTRREALAAGLIYAASPIALLGSVRVGQDPLVTMLGMAGVLALLYRPTRRGALAAGLCLGVALWVKYPAAMFVPVYAVLAPRRLALVLSMAGVTLLVLFAPYASHLNLLYAQSVTWQLGRGHMDAVHRVLALLSFLFVLNPLTLPALARRGCPSWVSVGFALGAVFGLANEVYYHYFMPVVPFAALLAAPLVARLAGRTLRLVLAGVAVIVALWATSLTLEQVQNGLGALSLSATSATVQMLDRITSPQEPVLADQFEYAYLANRPPATDYFWDMRNVTTARKLARALRRAGAVVRTVDAGPSYPSGFEEELVDRGYSETRVGSATVWLRARGHNAINLDGGLVRSR
jgi:hypothetical protein